MKTTMLDYCKMILQKVSFSRRLFLKEYRKSYRWLNPIEWMHLRQWIKQNLHQRVRENNRTTK
jgi:hypothetical protein